MPDEFGGIAVEDAADEFGGIPIDQPTEEEILSRPAEPAWPMPFGARGSNPNATFDPYRAAVASRELPLPGYTQVPEELQRAYEVRKAGGAEPSELALKAGRFQNEQALGPPQAEKPGLMMDLLEGAPFGSQANLAKELFRTKQGREALDLYRQTAHGSIKDVGNFIVEASRQAERMGQIAGSQVAAPGSELPLPSTEDSETIKAIRGIVDSIGGQVEGVLQPEMLPLLFTGALPGAIGKTATGIFMADIVRHVPDIYQQLKEASASGDTEKMAKALTDAIGAGTFLGLMGMHLKGSTSKSAVKEFLDKMTPEERAVFVEQLKNPNLIQEPPLPVDLNARIMARRNNLITEGVSPRDARVQTLNQYEDRLTKLKQPSIESEVSNASRQQETATVHGDLRTSAGEGEGQVPAPESSGGILAQAERGVREPSGGTPRNEPSATEGELSLNERVAKMTPSEFTEWTKTLPEGGVTRAAFDLAKTVTSEDVVNQLKERADALGKKVEEIRAKVKAEPDIAKKLPLLEEGGVMAVQQQFFNEAHDYAIADPNTSGGQRAIKEGHTPKVGPYTPEAVKLSGTLPLSEFKGEVPDTHIPIKVERPDGSTYEAWLVAAPGSKMAGTRIAKVKAETGGLTDGVLGKGDKIIEGPKTAEEYQSAVQPKLTEALPAYQKGIAAPSGTPALLFDPFFYKSGIEPLGKAAKALYDSPVIKKLRTDIEDIWNAAAIKSAPKLTRSSRPLGEAAVRYASSGMVGRTKGQIFADKVLLDSGIDPVKFGTALAEDNLRSIREGADPDAAARVRTLVGDETSPFRTEEEYQAFLNDPKVQAAIERHKQLWAEQKDPLFRQANDLDPDLPLETRGAQTGARINLKALQPDEAGVAPIGRPRTGFRQLATLKRRDPFGRRASGAGQAYEGHYHEIMANGFERELPVAAQHEFLKQLIDNGDAVVTDKMSDPELRLKEEGTSGYLLTLKPWTGKFIHVRKGLIPEFENISGLDKPLKLPLITAFNDFFTRQSVAGLAEGTTHASNLLTQAFTMPGPTANPMINAVLKSLGRVDLLYTIPKVLIKGFSNQRERMLELAEIGAAKEPYPGAIAKKILNPIDQGVRLVSDDIYKALAEKGIVENTETARREFINQVGQYNKKLQPLLTRKLRETGLNPFITAGQTFSVQGLRKLALAPGIKATSNARALALKADVAAGWMGGIVLTTMLNLIVSGKATGPAGTPLGAVGWVGDDKKVKNFNIMRLLGYERGLRITGIGPAIEAKRLGLSAKQQQEAAAGSVASSALSMAMGPGPRFATIAATGLRPTQPWIKEAPAVPPTDSLSPLKTQIAKNIETAVLEANPLVSSAAEIRKGIKEGKPASEIAQKTLEKQASRYTPKTGLTERTAKAMPKIVDSSQLKTYIDDVTKEARKLPLNKRMSYIKRRFEDDELEKKYRNPAWDQIKKKGTLKYR